MKSFPHHAPISFRVPLRQGRRSWLAPATFGRFPRRAGTIPQKSGRRGDLAGSLASEDTMSRPDQLWQQVRPPVRRL
jgi:hypothetical protein